MSPDDDCEDLLYDQACLQVWANNSPNVSLWTQSLECYNVSKHFEKKKRPILFV